MPVVAAQVAASAYAVFLEGSGVLVRTSASNSARRRSALTEFTCRKTLKAASQCEEFFRSPTADKSAASTLPSGLFEAFEVGARGTDKTPQGMPMEPAHKRVPIRARGEHKPTAVVRPCRANQRKASRQDITSSQKWLRISRVSAPEASGLVRWRPCPKLLT